MMNAPYSVNQWCSHPSKGNDDCNTGEDFATLEEARVTFAVDPKDSSVAFVELKGPNVYEVRKSANYRPSRDNDSDWRREIAYQTGMDFGCEAYNDVRGY